MNDVLLNAGLMMLISAIKFFPGDRFLNFHKKEVTGTIQKIIISLSYQLTVPLSSHRCVTTGTGYCFVGFNWIIEFLN